MNSRLYEAIEQAIIIPEQMELSLTAPTDHIFSDDYNKRMQKLINRQKKSYYPLICTSARRVACVIAAFFIMSMTTVLSVEALRKPFFDFIIGIFTDHSEVSVELDNSIAVPSMIKDKYELGILENSTITYSSETDKYRIIEYSYNGKIINFMQYTYDYAEMNVNTENATIEHTIINGYDALIWEDNTNSTHIMWNNGEYVFCLISDLGKNALIELAELVQKAEN